jgi:hypothetical protein
VRRRRFGIQTHGLTPLTERLSLFTPPAQQARG